MSFAPIEREPAPIEIEPYCRPDTMDRLRAGNADDAATFAATKSTRFVRRARIPRKRFGRLAGQLAAQDGELVAERYHLERSFLAAAKPAGAT
jgi:hypothetical protein